ncbi:putative RNA methyltransferase [Agarilytica rhodophyticola]|uniref:putative RNA methyltransferase n=1 Tax=Agarilytica rhodophyticola TaxID=1737490 RepID=UPI000B341E5C|nr:methyltransferase domain-containing protein [Agarilytica rhodophyticola]
MTAIWACPLCKSALTLVDNSLTCTNHHMFDRAKQGYVNLLPANKKRSLEPGDNAEMIDARRKFLNTGHYDFLMSAICQRVLNKMARVTAAHSAASDQQHKDRSFVCLDLGCGEGAYLEYITGQSAAGRCDCYGLDISKFAVKRAASLFKQKAQDKNHKQEHQPVRFAVASSYHIPVLDSSVDIAISVFAPLAAAEVARILKPGGILLRITPGPRHLLQLKQAIYSKAITHEPPKALEKAEVLVSDQIHRQVELEQQVLADLIAMTPLSWHGSRVGKEDLLANTSFTVDFNFIIQEIRFDG